MMNCGVRYKWDVYSYMRGIILAFSFLLCFIVVSCKTVQSSAESSTTKTKARVKDKMDFSYNSTASLTNMVDKAEATGKLIFVDIYTDWCTPCKMMDEDVFADDDISDFMKARFVNYKVDGEKHNGPNLGVMFGVAGFPTLLILDQKGRVLERHDGALYQSGLKAMADRALSKITN